MRSVCGLENLLASEQARFSVLTAQRQRALDHNADPAALIEGLTSDRNLKKAGGGGGHWGGAADLRGPEG